MTIRKLLFALTVAAAGAVAPPKLRGVKEEASGLASAGDTFDVSLAKEVERLNAALAEKDAALAELSQHRPPGRTLDFGASATPSTDVHVPLVHVITDELLNPTTGVTDINSFWDNWRAGADAAVAQVTYKNFGSATATDVVDVDGYVDAISSSCDVAEALVIAIPFTRGTSSYKRVDAALNECLDRRPLFPIFSTQYDTYHNDRLYGRALLFTKYPANATYEPQANLDAVSGRGPMLSAPVVEALQRCPGNKCQVVWSVLTRGNAAQQRLVAGLNKTLLENGYELELISPSAEDLYQAYDATTGLINWDYVSSSEYWSEYTSLSNGFQVVLSTRGYEWFNASSKLLCGQVKWDSNTWQIGVSPFPLGLNAVSSAAAAARLVASGGTWRATKGNGGATTLSEATHTIWTQPKWPFPTCFYERGPTCIAPKTQFECELAIAARDDLSQGGCNPGEAFPNNSELISSFSWSLTSPCGSTSRGPYSQQLTEITEEVEVCAGQTYTFDGGGGSYYLELNGEVIYSSNGDSGSSELFEFTVPDSTCQRPSWGCDVSHDVYTNIDCDGDGILDHMCTTTINSNRWLVLSSEGCPQDWGTSSRAASECAPTTYVDGCALYVVGPVVASQSDQVVETVDTFENYELAFTMELASDWSITGSWQSVFHIGDTDDQRLPGIFFHPSGGLHVRQSPDNWGVEQTTGDAFVAGETYEIRVVVESNQMAVYVDGMNRGTASGSATATATDAAVYVGNPWRPAAKVTLSHICLKPTPRPTCASCDQTFKLFLTPDLYNFAGNYGPGRGCYTYKISSGSACVGKAFWSTGGDPTGNYGLKDSRERVCPRRYVMDDTTIRIAAYNWVSNRAYAAAKYGHISTWDTSRVTDMSRLFCALSVTKFEGWDEGMGCGSREFASFNEDISAWDTSGLWGTQMIEMFAHATAFNQDLGWCVDGDSWRGAFSGTKCSSTSCGVRHSLEGCWLNDNTIRTAVAAWLSNPTAAKATYGHISKWKTIGVTDMSYLFCVRASWMDDYSEFDSCVLPASASSFNEDIGAWDTCGVTDMRFMFHGASAFNRDISAWDTSGVTRMDWMFSNASAFDRDLSWCVDDDVDLDDAFTNTPCASTLCGVIKGGCP